MSLAIYAGVPVLYFIGLFLERSTAPPGSAEEDFTRVSFSSASMPIVVARPYRNAYRPSHRAA